MRIDEVSWRQKSRAIWLQHDDKNNKFFHKKVDQRKLTNKISKLKYENGQWWRGEESCERIISSYFENLFSSSNLDLYKRCVVLLSTNCLKIM